MQMKSLNVSNFFVLCYHYVRPRENDRFPRILGNRTGVFVDHIRQLAQNYFVFSPEQITTLYHSDSVCADTGKKGLLFTFDDGLSDHYQVAEILQDFDIKAFFFIPTCILTDRLPANPTIVHYCLAEYGIEKFLLFFKKAAEEYGIDVVLPSYTRDNSVWKTIAEIKKIIKYKLKSTDSRKILLNIYKNAFLRDHPDAMEIMHLTKSQIKKIIRMGHGIGSHSHTHPSVAAGNLSNQELKLEIISSGVILREMFNVKVNAISYPFGETRDCLKKAELLKITDNYELAFTVEEKINTIGDSPLELGRIAPASTDTSADIQNKLLRITEGKLCV